MNYIAIATLVLLPMSGNAAFFWSKNTKKTPKSLFKELFHESYELKRKNETAINYQEICMAINSIKTTYGKKWQENKIKNDCCIATEISENGAITTKIQNDTLQPVFQKTELEEKDQLYFHGDLHGDVLSILSLISYLINKKKMSSSWKLIDQKIKIILPGDFTDRGLYSIETIIAVTKLLQKNPQNIFLTRGNHETRDFTLFKTLYQSFSNSNESDPQAHAEFVLNQWLEATSYLPHVLFLLYPKHEPDIQSCIACMHAAPPSYSVADYYTELPVFEKHLSMIQKFLNNKEESLATTKLDLKECYRVDDTLYFPPYLWNYTSLYNRKTDEKKLTLLDKKKPFLGAYDIITWLKKCSSKTISVNKIIKGHQQCERELFNQPNNYGIGNQFNGIGEKFENIITTLNIAPRCNLESLKDGFWENRVDTWATATIDSKKIQSLVLTPLYFDFENGLPIKINGQPKQKEQNMTLITQTTKDSN